MKLSQVVSDAIDILERPDLEELGFKNLRNVLNLCHSLAEFQRDVNVVQVTKDTVLTPHGHAVVPIDRLGRPVRRMVKITPLDQNFQPFHWIDFKPLPLSQTVLTDYFGNVHRHTYQLVGNCLNIWGLGNSFHYINLVFLTFPLIHTNEDGEEVTDSWILQAHPEMIVTALAWNLSKITQDMETQRSLEQEFALHRRNLLQNYGTETLSANSL